MTAINSIFSLEQKDRLGQIEQVVSLPERTRFESVSYFFKRLASVVWLNCKMMCSVQKVADQFVAKFADKNNLVEDLAYELSWLTEKQISAIRLPDSAYSLDLVNMAIRYTELDHKKVALLNLSKSIENLRVKKIDSQKEDQEQKETISVNQAEVGLRAFTSSLPQLHEDDADKEELEDLEGHVEKPVVIAEGASFTEQVSEIEGVQEQVVAKKEEKEEKRETARLEQVIANKEAVVSDDEDDELKADDVKEKAIVSDDEDGEVDLEGGEERASDVEEDSASASESENEEESPGAVKQETTKSDAVKKVNAENKAREPDALEGLSKRLCNWIKALPSPEKRRENMASKEANIEVEKLAARDFLDYLEVDAHSMPGFNHVQALAKRLDQEKNQAKVLKVLERLSLTAQLYLYELIETHQEMLKDIMTDSYLHMQPENEASAKDMQSIFKGYLQLHKNDKHVHARYEELLQAFEAGEKLQDQSERDDE